jgi:hypothetical protein
MKKGAKVKEGWLKAVLIFFLVILVIFEIIAIKKQSSYIYDTIVVIGFMIGVYMLRHKLHLHPLHLFLLGIFVTVHSLGVFNFYFYHFWGVEFDTYVHTYYGFVSSLILLRMYSFWEPKRTFK